ncbi:MAG: ABC transporter substrate-binding protein [Vicinamibacteria bacterium]
MPCTPRHRPNASVLLAVVAALALGAFPPLARAQAKPPAARVLTASQGPRQGAWKRSFNPFRGDGDSRWPAPAGVYEPLLVFNRATGDYVPWLATAYEWSGKNLKLRFTLRPGVQWSDGTPFSARDVAFTFDLLHRVPGLDRESVWAFLTSVSAVDPGTVEFTLRRPFIPGLASIAQEPIVAEHKWRDVARPAEFDDPSPVGTGPFTEVKRFEPTVYELGRNPKYWQAGKPGVDLLRVPLYRSNEEVLRALQAGELDWASLFLPDIEKSWVTSDAARHQYWYPDFGPTALLYLNTQQKPFDDANVRKALSMALDRPRIMREALSDYAPPADATGLADSQKRWKDPTVTASGRWTVRDVAQANRLLDAAGLARGADQVRGGPAGPMRYEILVVQGWSDWMAAAEIMRQNLAEVGVAASVKAADYNAWDDALRRGRFTLGMGFGARGPTPYQFYRGLMDATLVRPVGTRAEANFGRFVSDEAAKLLRQFESTSDEKEQVAVGLAIQRVFIDSAPSLPLYASPLWGVFNTTRLAGFPSRFRPFASAAPGGADSLPVLIEVKPR